MYGRATAAMEVSSTSMNVANITAMATSHGLAPPGADVSCGVILFLGPVSFRKKGKCRDAPKRAKVDLSM
jgi:hypothetical protein